MTSVDFIKVLFTQTKNCYYEIGKLINLEGKFLTRVELMIAFYREYNSTVGILFNEPVEVHVKEINKEKKKH